MGAWEFIAVLIIILALLGAKGWQSPEDQETTRRGLLLGLIFFVAGFAWYLGLQAH